MLKKSNFLYLSAISIAILLIYGFFKPALALSPFEQAIDGAKKEGEIVFYESQPEQDWIKIMENFQKRYPFIKKYRHERLTAGDNMTRLIMENQAKAPTADMAGSGVFDMISLSRRGVFREVDWKALGILQKTIYDRYLLVQSSFITVIAYNTQLVSEKDAPKTWDDLVDSRWKGKIAASFRTELWAGLAAAWGQSRAEAHLKKMLSNDFVRMRTTTAVTTQVTSSQSPVGIGSYNLFEKAQQTGAPIRCVLPDPVILTQLVTAIPVGAKNPNTAKLLIHWLVSSEGAKIYENYTGRGNPYIPGTEYEKLMGKLNISSWSADRFDEYIKISEALGAILRQY